MSRFVARRPLPSPGGQPRRFQRVFTAAGIVIADSHSPVELTSRLTGDRFGQGEFGGAITTDRFGQAEFLSASQSNMVGQTEVGGAIAVISDRFAQLEFLSNVLADRLGQIDFLSTIITDRLAQLDVLSAQRVDLVGNIESRGIFRLDGIFQQEAVSAFQLDRLWAIELLSSRIIDALGQIELAGQAAFAVNSSSPMEWGISVRSDSASVIEFQFTSRSDTASPIEESGQATISIDGFGRIEISARIQPNTASPAESLGSLQVNAATTIEYPSLSAALFRGPSEALLTTGRFGRTALLEYIANSLIDAKTQIEALATQMSDTQSPEENLAVIQSDRISTIEALGGISPIANALIETLQGAAPTTIRVRVESGLTIYAVQVGLIEYAVGVVNDARALTEMTSLLSLDASGPVETLHSFFTSFDIFSQLEISGFGFFFDSGPIVQLESGAFVRVDVIGPMDNQKVVLAADPQLGIAAPIEQGAVVYDPAHPTSLNIGRVRILTAPYTSLTQPPFDPLPALSYDTFCFDFTPEVGAATILSTAWVCTLQPGSPAIDTVPQARVLYTWVATQVYTRSPLDNMVQPWSGQFSVALIGVFPILAIGGTYQLQATVQLSDGRVLQATSTVLCSATAISVH